LAAGMHGKSGGDRLISLLPWRSHLL
jgi:hypothetical protein